MDTTTLELLLAATHHLKSPDSFKRFLNVSTQLKHIYDSIMEIDVHHFFTDDWFPEVVKLNVGGKCITTFLSTLTKDPESMLAAMFSGRHEISKDEDGRFFIDCNGSLFECILDFLRFGTLPPKDKALEIYDIAVYFNVQSLVDSLESYRAVQYRKGIEEMRTSLDMLEYNRLKQDAVQQLYKCYARPEDDIIIAFMSLDYTCSAECSGKIQSQSPPYINFKHTIFLKTSDKRTQKIKLCIAHDLNELGFGKYVFTDKAVSFRCLRCQKVGQANDTVLLVAYKIIERWNAVPSMFWFV